jgi:putative transcriptional regulator
MQFANDELNPPLLLIAMPQVIDPFFHRSVVLLLEHGADGSVGLIVNRPTELTLERLLADLGLLWGGEGNEPAWFGGPVHPQVGTLLFGGTGEPGGDDEQLVEVGEGLRLTQDARVIGRVAATAPEEFRLLVGSAGWSPGQLEQELGRNDWLIAPFAREIVFERDPDAAWTRALASIGVRPEALPSTITGEDDGGTN